MARRRSKLCPAAMIVAAFVFAALTNSRAANAQVTVVDGPFSLVPVATSQPAARPAKLPAEKITQWFNDLDDTAPAVRDAARVALMGLPREQLDVLHELATKNKPLTASQAAGLREVVVHVFLTGEPYAQEPMGFMGVRLADFHQRTVSVVQPDPGDAAPAMAGPCVIIAERKPGFCAYQALQDNDLVLGVIGADVEPIQTLIDLQQRVKQTTPGESITLQVIRNGKPIRVTFPVSGRPAQLQEDPALVEFTRNRRELAQQYWEKHFGPLLPGKIS